MRYVLKREKVHDYLGFAFQFQFSRDHRDDSTVAFDFPKKSVSPIIK